jgi:hypothetical protein
MLGTQGVSLRVHRAPKFILRKLLRCQPFRKQRVQLFPRPRKTRQGALFDRNQRGIHDLFYRLVGAPPDDSLNPPLLFWRQMNGNTAPPFVFIAFRLREIPLPGNAP